MLLGHTVGSAPDHPNKASRDLFTGGEGLASPGVPAVDSEGMPWSGLNTKGLHLPKQLPEA